MKLWWSQSHETLQQDLVDTAQASAAVRVEGVHRGNRFHFAADRRVDPSRD